MPFSLSLIIAVAIQLGCQAFKVVFYSLRNRRFSFHWFFSAGGMPSAHTAFVAALAVSVGLARGFASELFAVAFVFATIVIYDILRMRAAVQTHSRILKVLLEERRAGRAGRAVDPESRDPGAGPAGAEPPPLPPEVGHSFAEVVAGLAVGVLGALALHRLLVSWVF